MFYFKKFISYIDYFENGEKIKNAGHIRVIIQENECTLDIHIKGLKNTDNLSVPIQTMQGITLGKIELVQGAGRYLRTYSAGDMDGLGASIDDINGLQIQIAPDRYCCTVWKEPKMATSVAEGNLFEITVRSEELQEDEVISGELQEEQGMNESSCEEVKGDRLRKEKSDTDVVLKAVVGASDMTEGTEKESLGIAGETEKTDREVSDVSKNPDRERERLYPDKWQQLRHRYENVHPFEKEDEFISIEPKDFIIMRQEYQNLVNNSFLLHGFYNYRHIILGRKNGNPQYYIGVPGTYYDREKMVAVMFGFEGFEPSGEDVTDRNIEQGTYGYYMKRVNI